MSTLWTPEGERPIRRDPPTSGGGQPAGPGDPTKPGRPGSGATGSDPTMASPDDDGEATDEEMAAQLDELRQQLAGTPAALVVANHAFGLFELAALHLSLQPPKLAEAQVAIDAFGALVEGMAGRLGEHEPQLREGLAQLRIAFVQVKAAHNPN